MTPQNWSSLCRSSQGENFDPANTGFTSTEWCLRSVDRECGATEQSAYSLYRKHNKEAQRNKGDRSQCGTHSHTDTWPPSQGTVRLFTSVLDRAEMKLTATTARQSTAAEE